MTFILYYIIIRHSFIYWSLFSPDFPLSPPALTLLSPSAEALKERKSTLVCLAEDISVALVHVTWSVNGRSVTDGVWSSPTEKQQDKTFKMSSYLTIESSDWTDDADFSCEVSVGSKFTKKSISVSQCWKPVWIKISNVLSLFLDSGYFISDKDCSLLQFLFLILELKIFGLTFAFSFMQHVHDSRSGYTCTMCLIFFALCKSVPLSSVITGTHT